MLYVQQRQDDLKKLCDSGVGVGCLGLARLAQEAGNIKQALWKKICDLDYGIGCLVMGNVSHNADKLKQAKNWYKKACELVFVDPFSSKSTGCVKLGEIAFNAGNIKQAKFWFKKGCDFEKKFDEFPFKGGLSCLYLKNLSKFSTHFSEIFKNFL